ncbi:J domain-containing protein [Elioraea sp.]|uniref:J domain-containing protein n=1 Tax=Elioraea sp. TaxID=2185103 RepID=UPI0025C12EE7|nr:J domain-containing protein [Elioraea sp.]
MRNGTARTHGAPRNSRLRADAPQTDDLSRPCDRPGCAAHGGFRAPKSRRSLNDYYWFCLEHVREYNRAWDYYKGMSPGEIESEMRRDTTWQRPTWPLGRIGLGPDERVADPFGVLGNAKPAPARETTEIPAELRSPLATLDLPWPVTRVEVKRAYKALAKRHHPDANSGDKAAEDKLKTINAAYTTLIRVLPAGG